MIILSEQSSAYHCGAKANILFSLKALGFKVPAFVVIPQQVCADIIKSNTDPVTAITAHFIPESSIEELTNLLPGNGYFAVRSSSTDEDGNEHSFAGQFESYLYVTKEQLAHKIKQVWLSAFSSRVADYRKTKGFTDHSGIAVIVQEMLAAEVAGVGFGINPVTGNRKEIIISAVYGLGEGLVSGELNADTFNINNGNCILKDIVEKTHQVQFDHDTKSGTIKTVVASELATQACLSDEQLLQLKDCLDTLFKHYHRYQDIEFAFKNGQLYLLQTRPITTTKHLADNSGERIIWDNSNIIESYPGVTTPLTFSFILNVYESVYRQFVQLMGVSEKEVENHKETFANMLGLINGRVYYNLLSWYKALALLPGYSINAAFMEKMMGVKERFELKDASKRNRFTERLRVLNMMRVLLKNLRSLPKMRSDFVRDFSATMTIYEAMDFNTKNAGELMNLYLNFEQTLLKKWKAPLVNDFFAMIYFGVLQKLVVRYHIDEHGAVQNDLLCGAKDIISTEPIHRCLKLAGLIRENEQTKQVFLYKTPEEIQNLHLAKQLPAEISQQINEYIHRFGNRCVGELKLETITYKQNPAAFIRIIKSYVQQGVTAQSTQNTIEHDLRTAAEEKVKKALKYKPLKKLIFTYFLKRTRILVSARENLRYERTRAFGVVRELFCSMGTVFFAEGLISHPNDIFYLGKEEIFDYIKGTSLNFNLKELISIRKTQFASFESKPTLERLTTLGIVYAGNDFFQKPPTEALTGDLRGLGCCPGRVSAKIQVVHKPEDVKNLNGHILVTSSTDPGWVTLFPTASGILVERGSLLSHSAIVSREMGKPCIVGITGLLERLKTGDVVEMDGATGYVKIISQ
jgi:phosphohistidine swiveling domain-containing protein